VVRDLVSTKRKELQNLKLALWEVSLKELQEEKDGQKKEERARKRRKVSSEGSSPWASP
jgi:predicted CopG family antitoxin